MDNTDLSTTLRELAALVHQSRHVVFFTGAGISVPSGIPDFRSENGVWAKYDPYVYASIQGFERNPTLVWAFLKKMYAELGGKQPNPAHYALTTIQQLLGNDKVTIITQNIDGLHQKAGSKNVIEFHGSFSQLVCIHCNYSQDTDESIYAFDSPLPVCPNCGAILKPAITFFGESPPTSALSASQSAFHQSDVAIAIGSSLEVVPASLFFLESRGVKALFNFEPIRYQHIIQYFLPGDVAVTLPFFVEVLRESRA